MDLFDGVGDWDASGKLVSVFKLYPQFLRNSSDAELTKVIVTLRRRGIALAIEFGLLHQRATCGHVEGHDLDQVLIAQRIRRLGGELAYFAADEPLWFGHSLQGTEGCRAPLSSMAEEAASTARSIRSVFPQVKFLDIEPVSNFQEPDWVEMIASWHTEFARAFGEPFYALNLDIDWARPWQSRVVAIATRMRSSGMRVGGICNGDPRETTDAAWIRHALERCNEYARVSGRPPELVIFQSWVTRPVHVLPEGAPDTFTHLLLDYSKSHAVLGASGRLPD